MDLSHMALDVLLGVCHFRITAASIMSRLVASELVRMEYDSNSSFESRLSSGVHMRARPSNIFNGRKGGTPLVILLD
ncbi:hypothetical protein F4778DRAFT_724000 [Xylariomycetidae sp. FL2044]|nr:hypothetical protein F4778DRAFT_724000 [Xylariomycetidae sp. FL2044]